MSSHRSCKVLVVDDDESVHHITKLILERSEFPGWKPVLLHAMSGKEARAILVQHPDIAVVLLDVIMEHDEAGLDVARFIREELGNRTVRIIIRTGQPGIRPDGGVLATHDINDFRTKTELTSDKLYACVLSAMRNHAEIESLQKKNAALQAALTCLERMHHPSCMDGRESVQTCADFLRHLVAHLHPQDPASASRLQPVAWFGHWEPAERSEPVVIPCPYGHSQSGKAEDVTLPASHRDRLTPPRQETGWHRDAEGVTGWMQRPGGNCMLLFHATPGDLLAPEQEASVMIALAALAHATAP